MDNSFTSIIDSATSILILLPVNPSFDTAAAGLSLYLALMGNKQVTVSCPSPITVGMNRIIGIQKISPDLGNKNLTIRFKGYDAASIEKVSYDIINGEFNLTVVPKSAFSAPTPDQMEMGYKGVSADLVILIGGANDDDFPALSTPELNGVKVMHVGNRVLNTAMNVMSLARPGSSVSEAVAGIIKDSGLAMDPDIATNLVMGIESGSSNFASPEVTPDTFETFAELLRNGGKRQSTVKLSPIGFPPGSIPTQPFGKKVSQVLQVPQVSQDLATQQPQIQENDAADSQGTSETEQDINPPDDWLKPKVIKGATNQQPQVPSENKG